MAKKIGEFEIQELTEAMKRIADTFTGADGGADYITLCSALRKFESEAIREGNEDSNAVIYTVIRFARLITAVTKR